jgi:HAD superfamily, subfamily IIIB (Acid phosphatase)
MLDCAIFDIDGTLADLAHRLPMLDVKPVDWDAFFLACGEDRVIQHACDFCAALRNRGLLIVLSTSRPERVREITNTWFANNTQIIFEKMYMRNDGDYRPDYIVKRENLTQIREDGYNPLMVFDDRREVIEMFTLAGVPGYLYVPVQPTLGSVYVGSRNG